MGDVSLVMGIVNVTPDSFSDGGAFLEAEAAIAHGRDLLAAGADLLDIGGESTRPGAVEVSATDEAARVVPVIEALAADGATVSVDTSKAVVAEAALAAGASIVNDVTALADPGMAPLCASAGAGGPGLILMHMKGTPRTMQEDPVYGDVVGDVRDFLAARMQLAIDAGVDEERIWLDPGIGFGKTVEHNLELIGRLGELVELGRPIVIGASRKNFIGRITDREVGDRLGGSIASNVLGLANGAEVLRVHDVAETIQAVRVAERILGIEAEREGLVAGSRP
jgi:dihydropteroate synthase